MRGVAGWISRLGPPLALMALIWLLSSRPGLSTGLGFWDLVLRKLAHMTEFGALFLLWLRALGWRPAWAAALIALGWAVVDEIHQSTVPDRHGTPLDVLIDSVGIALAWALWRPSTRR